MTFSYFSKSWDVGQGSTVSDDKQWHKDTKKMRLVPFSDLNMTLEWGSFKKEKNQTSTKIISKIRNIRSYNTVSSTQLS